VLSEHRSSGATNISRPTSTFNANSRKFLEQFISPPALREAQVKRAYLFIYNENRTKVHNVLLLFKNILVISVRPIISTSTGQIFTKFAGLVELWP